MLPSLSVFISNKVKEAFYAKAQKCLMDIVNKAGKSKQKPKWMHKSVYKDLKSKRLHPDFQKKSKRALANKRSNTKEGRPIDPGHRLGSISTLEVAECLAQKNEGTIPRPIDLYVMGHSVPVGDGGRKIVGEKVKKIVEKYKDKEAEYEAKGIDISEEERFYDVVGGRQHGAMYGLGTDADLYYQKSCNRLSNSTTSYTPLVISVLQERLEKAEIARETVEKANEERIHKAEERAESVEKALMEVLEKLDVFMEDHCKEK